MASSFGIESATLLKIVADVDPSIPVVFLDTGWLFPETLAYRDTLVARLGLTDVRTITPSAAALAQKDPERDLWAVDPDACCYLRKVEPLGDVLNDFDAWINGRKRYQGGQRSGIPAVEVEGSRLKFNPLARVTPAEITKMFKSWNLPRHPLAGQGFTSLGCMPCTRRTNPGDYRARRPLGRQRENRVRHPHPHAADRRRWYLAAFALRKRKRPHPSMRPFCLKPRPSLSGAG